MNNTHEKMVDIEKLIATNPEILGKICLFSDTFTDAFRLRQVCKALADYALISTMLKGYDSFDWRTKNKDIEKIAQDDFYLKYIAPRIGFLEMETHPHEAEDPETQLYMIESNYRVDSISVDFDFLLNFHFVGIKSDPYRRMQFLPSDEMVEKIQQKNVDFFVDGRQICDVEEEHWFRNRVQSAMRDIKRLRRNLGVDFSAEQSEESGDEE